MIKPVRKKHTDDTVETDDTSASSVRIFYSAKQNKSVIIPIKALYIQEQGH